MAFFPWCFSTVLWYNTVSCEDDLSVAFPFWLQVDDINSAVADLKAKNIRTLSAEPRIGAHGKPVMFLHPKDCDGVLVEIEQAWMSLAERACGSCSFTTGLSWWRQPKAFLITFFKNLLLIFLVLFGMIVWCVLHYYVCINLVCILSLNIISQLSYSPHNIRKDGTTWNAQIKKICSLSAFTLQNSTFISLQSMNPRYFTFCFVFCFFLSLTTFH